MSVLTGGDRPPGFPGSYRAPDETVLAYHTPNSSLKPTKLNAERMPPYRAWRGRLVGQGHRLPKADAAGFEPPTRYKMQLYNKALGWSRGASLWGFAS